MSGKSSADRQRVAILAYEGLCTFEFGIAVELFALSRPELDVDWYECRVFSCDKPPLTAMGGFTVTAAHGPEAIDWADTIIIPGWKGANEPVPAELCDHIAAAHRNGARLVSICSGVFVLAAAGLLEGARAVTHWRYVEALQKRYPGIKVERDSLYIDEGNVLTSAGSAAGLDLCLYLVKQDFGSKIANAVARRLVLPTHREGGQTQFIPAPVDQNDTSLAPFLDWLLANLSHPHTITSMARHVGQSERTFVRRFKSATGLPPHAWLTAERIRRARGLLETTKLPTSVVAESSGFSTPETFRHHFRKMVGVAPAKYRASFRSA